MKIRLEMPDLLVGRAKSVAASLGVSLSQFVAEALREKLGSAALAEPKPWMKHLGKLRRLRKETKLIDKRIQDALEQIDPDE